jgi:hypothetical protein
MILDLDTYLDKVAKDIFIQQFSQILALENLSEAQILLKALFHKAKNSSFPDPEFKYHRTFLANVPFDYFKKINYCHPEHNNSINTFISQLAPVLYYEIAEDSKQLADKILSGLLPSIYSTLTDTSYENTIGKYQESLLQPINNNAYLWDPHEFHDDLIEANKALCVIEDPNFLPHQKMLKFLSDDSPLVHLFRHYIAQSYSKPSNLSTQHQLLFWRSLIFSSFTDFSSVFPHNSHQILQKLQLLPALDEVQSLFVHGPLGDQYIYFPLASSWGHTSTIELLLQYCADISSYVAGKALQNAAKSGHATIVELLHQLRNDIFVDHAGLALQNAARYGHTFIVKFILQNRNDIYANSIGLALQDAARYGHALIVEFILESHNDIPPNYIGQTLECVAQDGNTSVVKLLLHYCADISADRAGEALKVASKSGYKFSKN